MIFGIQPADYRDSITGVFHCVSRVSNVTISLSLIPCSATEITAAAVVIGYWKEDIAKGMYVSVRPVRPQVHILKSE